MNKIILSPEALKEISKQNVFKSLGQIAFDWLVILSVIALTQSYFHWALYIVAVMVIANRQHGLLILMHDSSHFRYSRNKALNDFLGELLTAWPLFIRMRAYRERHLAHHQHSNTLQDPDFRPERYPRFRGAIIKMLVKDALALNTLEQFKEITRLKVHTSGLYKTLRALFYVTAIATITYFNAWTVVFMYWIVPAFTWLKVCLRMRSIADHTGLQHNEAPYDTRTIVPTLFDRIFFAPHSSSYHFGHHMYAAVPCYNLKKLHALIMHADVDRRVHVTPGFFALLQEFPRHEAELHEIEKTKKVSLTQNMPVAN